jgi:hypothetical protein
MTGIFIFTAGNDKARQHLRDSIIKPIDSAKVFANSNPDDHQTLQQIETQAGGFYAWVPEPGKQNEPNWHSMTGGRLGALCLRQCLPLCCQNGW